MLRANDRCSVCMFHAWTHVAVGCLYQSASYMVTLQPYMACSAFCCSLMKASYLFFMFPACLVALCAPMADWSPFATNLPLSLLRMPADRLLQWQSQPPSEFHAAKNLLIFSAGSDQKWQQFDSNDSTRQLLEVAFAHDVCQEPVPRGAKVVLPPGYRQNSSSTSSSSIVASKTTWERGEQDGLWLLITPGKSHDAGPQGIDPPTAAVPTSVPAENAASPAECNAIGCFQRCEAVQKSSGCSASYLHLRKKLHLIHHQKQCSSLHHVTHSKHWLPIAVVIVKLAGWQELCMFEQQPESQRSHSCTFMSMSILRSLPR